MGNTNPLFVVWIDSPSKQGLEFFRVTDSVVQLAKIDEHARRIIEGNPEMGIRLHTFNLPMDFTKSDKKIIKNIILATVKATIGWYK